MRSDPRTLIPYSLALAALLHDIGKLLERTGLPLLRPDAEEFNFTYSVDNRKYMHAVYTGRFFDGQMELPQPDGSVRTAEWHRLLKAFNQTETEAHWVGNLAGYHHKPGSNPLNAIVAAADRMASGFERNGNQQTYESYAKAMEEQDEARMAGTRSGRKTRRLRNAFTDIRIHTDSASAKGSKNPETFYPLEPLHPGVQPCSEPEDPQGEQRYQQLLEHFINGIEKIDQRAGQIQGDLGLDNIYAALDSAYEQAAWCVPAATVSYDPRTRQFTDIPTSVSLYDHSRSASAIAVALFAWHAHQDGVDALLDTDNHELCKRILNDYESTKFCFIRGDFSGIQPFIFDAGGESNKYAAKILRSKSFYVSILTELAAVRICRELDLPLAAIVMNAGGQFSILAGNLGAEHIEQAISRVRQDINQRLRELSFGQTSFQIAALPFAPERLLLGNYQDLMADLAHQLDRAKYRQPIEQPVFDDYLDQRQDRELCRICGMHWEQETQSGICEHCNQFRQLGEKLVETAPDRRFYVHLTQDRSTSDTPRFPLFGNWHLGLGKSPEYADLTWCIDRKPEFSGFAHKRIGSYIPRFEADNQTAPDSTRQHPARLSRLQELAYQEIPPDKRRALLTSAENPSDQSPCEFAHQARTFYHLAQDARNLDANGTLQGAAHLGVLKADVDHLGQVFTTGFGTQANISRIAMLSRTMDYFFTGWLQWRIASEPQDNRPDLRSIYTVFSGGDDLFLIGPWNQIVQLATEVDQHLRTYAGKNPDVHLSAGIVLRKPTIPVREMAQSAERALEKAKDGDDSKNNRNRISLFGQTVTWSEYHALQPYQQQLLALANPSEGEGMARGFLYRILEFIEDAQQAEDKRLPMEQRMEAAKWRARFRYLLARNYARNFAVKEQLESTIGLIQANKQNLRIPLSHVIYSTRR